MKRMKKKTFYITTPIYYPSGKLHIGNASTTILCDVLARYRRMKGFEVFFLTGIDEHGEKIEKKAKELNVTPKQYVDKMAEEIKELWKLLDISNDKFIRTSDIKHEEVVAAVFEKLLAKGDIYLGEYEGWYSVSDEEFFTESQLSEVYRDENNKIVGGLAPSGNEVSLVREEAYFFRIAKYQKQLLEYYKNHPNFITPDFRINELLNNFFESGLEDLAITRTSFSWGVKVPSNPKHIVYVWIDALLNYITALGYGTDNTELFDKFWPANVHVIAKEIVRFHAIYWPVLLMALEIPLPENILAHGWIIMKDGKMSKSKGNVVYPDMLVERYGVDVVRYYLTKIVNLENDGQFSPEDFVERVNSDLANDLGNLLNRTIAMINKYFGGVIPEYNGDIGEYDEDLRTSVTENIEGFLKALDSNNPSKGLDEIWKIISRANKYIDQTSPWILAKDGEKAVELESVMRHLSEVLRIVAVLIKPVLTQTSVKIFDQLGLEEEHTFNDLAFGKLKVKTKVIEKGVPVFPRLDTEEETAFIKQRMSKGN